MTQYYKWTCYGITGLVVLIAGLQIKMVSPHVFQKVTVAMARLQDRGFFDHAPQGDFQFK